jgi:transaldolase / glucose-6-phosphate isomerase
VSNQNPLIALDEAGTSVWLDYIRRKLVASGEMQRLVDEDGLRGMTSNPTIFEKAIAGSTDYDVQIRDLVGQGLEPLRIFQVIATDDIREACDVLRPIYDRLNRYDGYVSIEVSPGAAGDTQRTLDEAHELWKMVNRPNVMIKVPGTREGLPAIEQLISEGINVNITLLFNVDNYVEVTERYIRGLERRREAGGPIDHVASVASFFVSRVDSAVDKQLQAKIDGVADEAEKSRLKQLQGKAAIANAKMAYERFEQIFAGPRWQPLADAGAMVQRPLWASTSTKNPEYRDVMYVEELIGLHTVNTMPQATMNAFKDHGRVSRRLTENLVQARIVLSDLALLRIDMDEVTRQLQTDGVRLFAESFDELIECIDSERTAITMGLERSEFESLGSYQAAVEKELEELRDAQFTRRLWEKDASLWSSDETEQATIKNALGWMNIVETMQEQLPQLEEFADTVRSEGFTDAVVLGMGGSSLCPDVIAHTFPHSDGYPRLSILDSTDPDAVLALASGLDSARTLFIVSSKSGTTAEPLAFYHYFWNKTRDAGVAQPGRNFVAITDPGTPLETEANKQGFRHVFSGAPDIGGRYSALSNFGLVPAAVMGVDVRELLSRAETMVHATQPCVGPAENPGVRLGAILGVLAREGRDKLTLCVSPEIGTFGWWVEQLIAESTGKSGTGILPVEGEKLGEPDVYGDDRIFVCLRLRSSGDDHAEAAITELEGRLQALEKAGQPVVVLELKDTYDLGGEFFLWEIATATAGSILRINAFNQPNVQESKDNTNRLLAEYETSARLPEPDAVLQDGKIKISGPNEDADNVGDYLTSFLNDHVKSGSYVAFMAYVEPSAEHSRLLERIRLAVRDRFKVATTVGYGPRFLHSTGQFHKGGPAEGVFVQIVAHDPEDVAIEGQPFSFGTLIAAQSLGDFQALQKHERPVVRFDLGSDVDRGLEVLASGLAGAVV